MDFNVLHLVFFWGGGGGEVFLGTHWLSTLGKISHDFHLLTMKFLY